MKVSGFSFVSTNPAPVDKVKNGSANSSTVSDASRPNYAAPSITPRQATSLFANGEPRYGTINAPVRSKRELSDRVDDTIQRVLSGAPITTPDGEMTGDAIIDYRLPNKKQADQAREKLANKYYHYSYPFNSGVEKFNRAKIKHNLKETSHYKGVGSISESEGDFPSNGYVKVNVFYKDRLPLEMNFSIPSEKRKNGLWQKDLARQMNEYNADKLQNKNLAPEDSGGWFFVADGNSPRFLNSDYVSKKYAEPAESSYKNAIYADKRGKITDISWEIHLDSASKLDKDGGNAPTSLNPGPEDRSGTSLKSNDSKNNINLNSKEYEYIDHTLKQHDISLRGVNQQIEVLEAHLDWLREKKHEATSETSDRWDEKIQRTEEEVSRYLNTVHVINSDIQALIQQRQRLESDTNTESANNEPPEEGTSTPISAPPISQGTLSDSDQQKYNNNFKSLQKAWSRLNSYEKRIGELELRRSALEYDIKNEANPEDKEDWELQLAEVNKKINRFAELVGKMKRNIENLQSKQEKLRAKKS